MSTANLMVLLDDGTRAEVSGEVDGNGKVGIRTASAGSGAASGGLTNAELRAAPVPVLDAGVAAAVAQLIAAIAVHGDPMADGRTALASLVARRRDADTSAIQDGDAAFLAIDEENRLKVSSKPASYPDITGSITAIQATIGTPVAGGTVEGDVSRASNVMMFASGTFAGVNVSFEGSGELTGDTNWYSVQAVRSNAASPEVATGALTNQPVYAWELSVNALKRVRVRCTARTSGTQVWRFVQGTYATEPIPAAQVSATQPVSGTLAITNAPTIYLDSVTNQALNATVTGTSRDGGATASFSRFLARAFADVAGTLRIESSTDNATWRRATPDTAVAAGAVVELAVLATVRYHRVVYVNGAVAQGAFQLSSGYFRT